MKHRVTCPGCSSARLKMYKPSPLEWDVLFGTSKGECPEQATYCFNCLKTWIEDELLTHMRRQPGIDPNAPAFWRLNGVKAKGKSDAFKTVFG